MLADGDLQSIESLIAAEIEDAVAFAETSPWEPVEDLTQDVYSRTVGDQQSAISHQLNADR
jgi:TPP-dependent pyruvate/acetoin dehydrogenase alpha subunit